MKTSFKPPKLNVLVVNTVKLLLPWLMNLPAFALKTRFHEADLQRLRQYKGQRMLLLPNHPSGTDPMVMMELSTRIDECFNYVAAREVFEYWKGLNGWLLQRCGVYSVIRGKADRESFKITRQLLFEGLRKLVIFIEGEISNENDQLIPFEAGVLQLAFWALEDLKKDVDLKKEAGKNESTEMPPLYAAPVIIKYIYDEGVEKILDASLDRLEKATGLSTSDNVNYYERMRALGQAVLCVHERGLNIKATTKDTISIRVERVKERLLGQMERYLALEPTAEQSYLERIRAVRNKIDTLIYSYADKDDLSEYEKLNLELRQKIFTGFYKNLSSLVNFLTFQEGRVIEREDKVYAPDYFHPERLMELLHRLEKEILGGVATHHPRTAVVKVGDVRNLTELFDEYLAHKKTTVTKLASELESEVATVLQSGQIQDS